jgi:hypothetical protein
LNWSTEVAERYCVNGLPAKFARWFWWATHKERTTSSIWLVRSSHFDALSVSPKSDPGEGCQSNQLLPSSRVGQPIELRTAGFHGKIVNFDLAGDPTIHISIDKSARVQAVILQEITALNKSAANIAPTIAAGGAATAR